MTDELVVVASERQVELLAAEGMRAETRRRLEERLAASHLQNTRFAGDAARRAALAMALPAALERDARAVELRRSALGWERTIDAIDEALGVLRARGVGARELGAVEHTEPIAAVLRRAMNALDARLERAGLVDERLRGPRLAEAIARARPEDVARTVGTSRIRARFVVRWDACDAAWWRALGAALARAGGGASVELPVVSKLIDATRANDPFEALVAEVASLLDEAPVEADVDSFVGDATFVGAVPESAKRVSLRRALDADAQARAAVAAVVAAQSDGASTDRIVIGVPRGASERARAALARHFEEAGIPLHLATREPAALGETALALLEAGASGLARRDVATLLRAGGLDASAISGAPDPRAARAAVRDLASALERTPTAEHDDPLERLVATAAASLPDRPERARIARRFGTALLACAAEVPRTEHARRARALFASVGLGARPGAAVRGALSRDDARPQLVAAELEAYARDARALESLAAALSEIEQADLALGGAEPCAPATFVHELRRAIRGRGATGASRAGAVRALPLEPLAGEALDLLIVVDANDGVLPARDASAGIVTPSLEDALRLRRIDSPRSLVELAAASAGARHVVLCHRTTDHDGAAIAPSPIVSWLERGGVAATFVHSAPLLGAPTTPHERNLALLHVAPDRAEELAPRSARIAAREIARAEIHARPDAPGTELLLDEHLRALLEIETGGGARPLSVTALERIARCPFQGFAAQVLGALDDDPRADDTPDRREEGILAHEALGAAFVAAAPLWTARPRDAVAIERVAMQAADAALARSGGALVRAALDRIRLEVARIVTLAIEDDTWDFAFAERSFGADGDEWPAFIVADASGRVALRGRIDRVDRSHDQVAVRAIDYKRRVSLPAIQELGGTAIQVPIYALVAQRALGASAARGRYLSTVSPARASTAAFDERFAELVAPESDGSTQATRAALELVLAIRRGEIAPRPEAPKWCASCGLDGACRRPRFAVTMVGREEGE